MLRIRRIAAQAQAIPGFPKPSPRATLSAIRCTAWRRGACLADYLSGLFDQRVQFFVAQFRHKGQRTRRALPVQAARCRDSVRNLPESLPSSGTPTSPRWPRSPLCSGVRPHWLAGPGRKRALTAKGVLRKQDVPAAAAIIGVKAPQAVRSAADLPELHLAWCAAVGMGLLTVEGGKASGDDPNRRAVYQGGIRVAKQGHGCAVNEWPTASMTKDCGNGRLMSESDDRFSRRDRRLRQGAAWIGAAGSTARRRDCRPGQPSGRKVAGPGLNTSNSNARHSRRLARCSRSCGQR